ncbi:carbon-nitrogen hydrolase family protein [Marinobacter sp. NP-4(2019)]|uniref:carbon-nitrogen hydrolase family protein n=1 Tax=Marinobacter sp. NP-4(2019) TaxID=2488665 RepID=UPI000FC3D7C0|nr:carbon-nitrogen hydrolase family protein [Marinobacter sp. NP-4(2019)]AZT84594.1 carbon-nitrogen hydrolase family protein [Marinobacter sp. NP-4(2019)]
MTNVSPPLVAAIQMVSTHDIDANLREAERLLTESARAGARVAVLPENFAVLATSQMVDCGKREASDAPVIRQFLADQARRLGIWIVGGSLPLSQRPDGTDIDGRVRATGLVYDDQGNEVGRYDKIHLFDAMVEDAHGQYRESDTFEPGESVVTVETPVGRLGMAICYDLRFPELFRALREKGADWICLPSAFTWQTGDAHWHALIRARAIENQVWVVAPGQGGQNSQRRRTYGHSLICDPWGKVVSEITEDGPGVITAILDPDLLTNVRTRMPVWEHRRL